MNIINTNLKFNGNMSYGNNPNEIILHHAEAPSCSIKDIHEWHKSNGWAGVGYHYFVTKSGKVYKGRPDNAVGSHCLGNNKDTLGICFEGAYNEETMPQVQIQAGRELISYLKAKYNISLVKRHKDLNNTDCPGANFPFAEIINNSNVLSKPTNNPINKVNINVDSWVKKMQEECNRQGFSSQTVDGIPGPNTLAGCPTLRHGASGNITKLLQEKLISLGYSCGPCSTDGEFGNATRVSVMQFQKDNGLEADGVVGQKTWKKLLAL